MTDAHGADGVQTTVQADGDESVQAECDESVRRTGREEAKEPEPEQEQERGFAHPPSL